jgi:hypothetical protein
MLLRKRKLHSKEPIFERDKREQWHSVLDINQYSGTELEISKIIF